MQLSPNKHVPNTHIPRIIVLAVPGTMLTSVATAVDVFATAGIIWNRIHGIAEQPVFDVRLVSSNGKPVPCNGVPFLGVHDAMTNVENADLIIVTALVGKQHDQKELSTIVSWLRDQHAGGTKLASFCTGAFLLAATGLLDGKTATTHWGLASRLQQMYPKITVVPHRLVADEGTLFTSGGSHGAMDLCLHLVQRFASREIAMQCAKVMVRDFESRYQSPYAVFLQEKNHRDAEIGQVQDYLESAYHQPCTVDELAGRVGMGKRTFERRFKNATGTSPKVYVQNLRIEAAKRILETENQTVEQITTAVGYEDPAAFSKLFVKLCGISPSIYRRKFAAR